MYEVTPLRVLAVLLFYAGLFTIIRVIKPRIEHEERRTAVAIGLAWAAPVFVANYLLYKADLMSFLPWVNNFMHTFLWIGICLTFLYLGVRSTQPMLVQIILFTTFSLIVKYAEHIAFGTWDQDNFFHVFEGNWTYILGWSIADGMYPLLTLWGLRFASRWIPGLTPT